VIHMNVKTKFPFCFYQRREDKDTWVALFGVRFRHQLHPNMDTNKTYKYVSIDYIHGKLFVDEMEIDMDVMVMPRDPNVE
jgi:hypothetical protein